MIKLEMIFGNCINKSRHAAEDISVCVIAYLRVFAIKDKDNRKLDEVFLLPELPWPF